MNPQNLQRHNKYRCDNLRVKIKNLLIKNLTRFINDKIKEVYNNKIGNKQLYKLSIRPFNLCYHRYLMTKTLKIIFSENIRNIHSGDKNKKLIEELLNEKDEVKRKYFENLFNLTFFDCYEHFTTKRVIEELQGLKNFLDIKNDENESKKLGLDDKEYLDYFEHNLNHYGDILLNAERRRAKKHE